MAGALVEQLRDCARNKVVVSLVQRNIFHIFPVKIVPRYGH